MLSQKSQDAAFFDMVHELVRKNELMQDADAARKSGQERRKERRVAFAFVQLLAPFDGVHLPDQADFRHVNCHDISTRGFSYFESPLPAYRHVVILFGKLPFRIFTAEIRQVRKTVKPDVYLVGCRILDRLSK
jgi:hypothetical protein